MRESYDVVVVGAGPAGSMAARYAAAGGADVLLIEKRQEVGSPVRCGEELSVDWLDEVGIRKDKRWMANVFESTRIHAPNGRFFVIGADLTGKASGCIVERDVFDKCLAEDAVKAGAKLHLKTACVGLERKDGRMMLALDSIGHRERIDAKIVVGADGYESQVGRWAGIDTNVDAKDVMTCFEYRMTGVEVDRRSTDVYFCNATIPGGYAWVFPKSDDCANVGIGVQVSKLKEPGMARRYLDQFVASQPHLAKGFPVKAIAGGVSVCQPLDKTVADGVMLVGDAARMIDPATGGGIQHACRSGKVAGEVAALAVKENDFSSSFLQRYETGWRDLFENVLWRDYMVKEKMLQMSDDTINKIIETLSEVRIQQLSVFGIIEAVKTRYPELLREFEDLL
jgi:digeranylgeranylglycerophospholipid reductase